MTPQILMSRQEIALHPKKVPLRFVDMSQNKPAEKEDERDHLGQGVNPAIELEKKNIADAGKRPEPEPDWRKPADEGAKPHGQEKKK